MADYLFDEHQQDRELVRLRMIEELCDPTTIRCLKRTGITRGWQCLEIGAGAGSVMTWMGNVVGDSGRVVGVDKNANYLRTISVPPLEVIEDDFLDVDLDSFDLAHCRYVLIHNLRSDEILSKLCKSLKPNGYLVVEEPDFTTARLLNSEENYEQQRVNNAVCRLFEDMGLDPQFGLTLPEKVVCNGLQVVDVDSRMHLDRGGSLMARMMATSTEALSDKYVATGESTEADIQKYLAHASDEQFWAVYYATVSVVARIRTVPGELE